MEEMKTDIIAARVQGSKKKKHDRWNRGKVKTWGHSVEIRKGVRNSPERPCDAGNRRPI